MNECVYTRRSFQRECDRYEELLVNPTIIRLVQARGDIDCGGARFVVIRYGNSYQLVTAFKCGHIFVCFDLAANPLEFAERVEAITLYPLREGRRILGPPAWAISYQLLINKNQSIYQ